MTNKFSMTDEQKPELKPADEPIKPEEPVVVTPQEPESSDGSVPEVVEAETVEEWKAKALKAQEVSENYKKENEKYRLMEKQSRVETLNPQPTTEEDFEQPDSKDAIITFFEKDKQDILEEVAGSFIETSDPVQFDKFKRVYPGINSLLNEALETKRPVSRKKIKDQIEEFVNYAKGADSSSVERARAEGAIEAQNAERADIGTLSSSKKTTAKQITDEDKEVEEETGGAVSAQRYREIRENREKRNQDW